MPGAKVSLAVNLATLQAPASDASGAAAHALSHEEGDVAVNSPSSIRIT